MAERALTREDTGNVSKIVWSGLLNGDTGIILFPFNHSDLSVQFSGTFSVGGTIILQGSNDGIVWHTVTDPQGNAISKTAAGIEQITEICKFYRPSVTAGDGSTDLTATIVMRRPR